MRSGVEEGGAEKLKRLWRGSGGGGGGARGGREHNGGEEGTATLRKRAQQISPAPCMSACLHVLRLRPGAEAFWQPSLGARGPGKAGLVPGLQ